MFGAKDTEWLEGMQGVELLPDSEVINTLPSENPLFVAEHHKIEEGRV